MPLKKILSVFLPLSFLFLLFTHPVQATEGCSLGLTLWYTSVLPSLLPFLIVSALMVKTGLFRYLNRLYAPLLRKIFRISEDSCYAVLMGFLCGFPMGAKVTADLVREQHISKEEGTYLLGFCNNVSPSFFINYICLKKLGYPKVPWALCVFFYAIPLLYGLCSRPFYHFPFSDTTNKKQAPLHRMQFPMLDACIMDSFATVTRLGGYIILFSILVRMMQLLPLPDTLSVLVSSLLEISCGIHQITTLTAHPARLITAYACACASFGGLSICAQTNSVLHDTPLNARSWITGRIILALLTPILLLLLPIPV